MWYEFFNIKDDILLQLYSVLPGWAGPTLELAVHSGQAVGENYFLKALFVTANLSPNLKLLRSPRIDSKEPIPPGGVAGGPVRQPCSYSVSSPHRLFKNSSSASRRAKMVPKKEKNVSKICMFSMEASL
jgi:hypothetical protein